MSDEGPKAELVMPFVAVVSRGGPFDDDAYVAGYEMGTLDAVLAAGLGQHEVTIRTDNAAQADLIAMHRGYRCELSPSSDVPEWTFALFERHPDTTGETETPRLTGATKPDACTQCGDPLSARACGPTHAALAAERGLDHPRLEDPR